MNLSPLQAFKHFETHHCVTGSLRHIYAFNGFDLSEEMLFGLGEGAGFIYWHRKGQPPFLGGRATPDPSLEVIVGRHTGVEIVALTATSTRKAENTLVEMLCKGLPVMLQVDMGFLPYFDFQGQEYHFGGHAIVACGYDAAAQQVLIADRDRDLHPVSLHDLAQARGSTFKPFPPKNKWFRFNFAAKREPDVDDIYTAIQHQAERMLYPPINNLGIKGIRHAAQRIPLWKDCLSSHALKWALFNTYVFISPVGGSGGGAFRYLFSRFLEESGQRTRNPGLLDSAKAFAHVADRWAWLGNWFKEVSEAPDPADLLTESATVLNELAELEQSAWSQLTDVVR